MFSYILPSGILIVSKNNKIVKSLPIEFRLEENQTLIAIPQKLDEQQMKEISVGLGFFALRSFSHSETEKIEMLMAAEQSITLMSGSTPMEVKLKDIIRFESSSGYTLISASDGAEYHCRKTLVEFGSELPASLFFMVRRGCLINRLHIKQVQTPGKDTNLLTDGTSFKVAFREAEAFKIWYYSISPD